MQVCSASPRGVEAMSTLPFRSKSGLRVRPVDGEGRSAREGRARVVSQCCARDVGTSAWGRTERGFTLVEMLVAVAVFAVASALAFGGLSALARARAELETSNTRLGRLQFTIGLIERDVRSIAARGVREGYGAARPALDGTRDRLELTRHGYANALALPRAELERVRWVLQRGSVQRQRFAVLDRTPGTLPVEDALLDGVERLEFRYLADDGRELAQWPPPRAADDRPPRAVLVVLTLSGFGEIRRLLELPEQTP